ncbi:MAG: N-acetyl-gamma-glutamyl-phosphate reductase [Armatimonadetes bacterium]|nr:MAG: N-acetyl-gamma-glutamyl-phosphate reductase [Armatimonadota bacterium]
MSNVTPRIGILGAAGYAAGEICRLLAPSSSVEITYLASDSHSGKPAHAAFPGLRARLPDFESLNVGRAIEACEFLFLAQSNGVAMRLAREFVAAGKKLVDVSADFRLKDPAAYPEWYGLEHSAPDLLAEAVYGLTELRRDEVRSARIVANPGCYPTASILGLAPLVRRGWIELDSIVIDAKSGVSGAGRSKMETGYLFSEANESVRAYGVAGSHRHTPEIEQAISDLAGSAVRVTFTPHLIPMTRGILSTIVVTPRSGVDEPSLRAAFEDDYDSEPFVRFYPPGEFPSTKATLGANACHIGLGWDRRTGRVTLISALDNLVKGAAGQAIQNMNLMLGLPETHALEGQGLWP